MTAGKPWGSCSWGDGPGHDRGHGLGGVFSVHSTLFMDHMLSGVGWRAIGVLAMFVAASACRKEGDDPPGPTPPVAHGILRVEHHVDGAALQMDTLLYVNEAGNQYDVSRLDYYLNEIRLLGTNGTPDHTIPGPFLVMRDDEFALDQWPAGDYSGMSLLLGLSASINVTGGLPNTVENLNMAWPDVMGGGYHFMKFEGHFLSGGVPDGYAVHLGTNACLPVCGYVAPFTLGADPGSLVLRFDLNEVFRTPHTYDLDSGYYTMGDSVLMLRIAENCADAFTLHVEP